MNCTRPLGGSLRSFANLIYTYLPELLWWLGGPAAWALQAYRLMLFVVLLLPGFLPHAFRYFFTSPHVWASSYGDSVRHRLDVYVPLGPNGEPLAAKEGAAVPIVVFVTGGAWIIGYRMWGFLLGFALQKHGVMCICVDYRNFPQARIPQMIDDVSDALDWVYEHASTLGGSPDDITLVGQSAGAHLSAMVLLRIMRQRKDASSRPPLRRFVGRELYEELIAAGNSPATAAATVEAGAEPGGSSAGRYLNDLKANDPAAYNALLTTRATFWGAEPPQPVSRCIDHLLSMIFFTIGTEGDAIRNPWDERSSPLGEKQINKYFKNFDTS